MVHPHDYQSPAPQLDVGDGILPFRDDLGPVITVRMMDIDGDHPAERCFQIGQEVEETARITGKHEFCFPVFYQMFEIASGLSAGHR